MSVSSTQPLKTVVRAGAGAGKTTQLIDTIINQARQYKKVHDRWPHIVAATFTKKATQELRERLILKACALKDDELLAYVTSQSQLHISTLHGVCSLFLKRYGFDYGLDPDFQIIEEAQAEKIARRVVKGVVAQHQENFSQLGYSFSDLVKALRKFYWIAQAYPKSKICSKEHYEVLIKNKIKENTEELFTLIEQIRFFDNQKADDFCNQIEPILSACLDQEDFDFSQVSEMIKELTIRKPSTKDEDLEVILVTLNEKWKKFKENFSKIQIQKDNFDKFIENTKSFSEIAKDFCQKFHEEKRTSGRLENDDLELFALEICRGQNKADQFFSKDWDYWLVDEYQDTSPIQVEILKYLIGQSPEYIVGDPQQSIYLFRGARSEIFEEKIRIATACEETQLNTLSKNYRSQPELLEFFNNFFVHTQENSQFQPMEPKERSTDGKVAPVHLIKILKPLKKDKPMGAFSISEEHRSVIDYIYNLRAQGCNYKDICILGSKNKDVSKMSQALGTYRIPNYPHIAKGFYSRREVIDALSILKFLIHPNDDLNLITVLRSPWFRVSDDKIFEVIQSHKEKCKEEEIFNLPYWNSFKDSSESAIQNLQKLIKKTKIQGLYFTFKEAVLNLGLLQFSRFQDPTGRSEANLWKLIDMLEQKSQEMGFNYTDFLSECHKSISNDGQEPSASSALAVEAINLMTVHGSKGLQFKHVILLNPEKWASSTGNKPDTFVLYDEESGFWDIRVPVKGVEENEKETKKASPLGVLIEEKRKDREHKQNERLLYVAMTRAEESVCMVVSEEKEKNKKKKIWQMMAPLLDQATVEGEAQLGSSLFSVVTFDSENYEPVKEKQAVQQSQSIDVRPVYKLDPSTQHLLPTYSVSALLNDQKIQSSASKKNPRSSSDMNQSAHLFGTHFHKFLEILKYQSLEKAEHLLTLFFGESPEEFKRAKKSFEHIKSLQNPPVMDLIKNGHTEWGFKYKDEEKRIIEGEIDLWGEVQDCIWVVDYKTGSSKYKDRAMQQLRYYAQALKIRLKSEKPFKLAVVYTEEAPHIEELI